MSRFFVVLLTIALLLVVAAFVTAPPPLQPESATIELPADLDAYLAERERAEDAQFGLIPGVEKRIRWYSQRNGERTEYVVVYVHGFSATRQETAPLAERVADALGANLFETRLATHGRKQQALVDVRAEDWLRDGNEALAIAAALGDKAIVIGTSTGATLALATMQHPLARNVAALVFVSPNFGPHDASADYLTMPGGPQLARLVAGKMREWEPANEAQGLYWTTRYPMDTVVEMMRLVEFTHGQLPTTLEQRILTIISPLDSVVSPAKTRAALQQITAAEQVLLEYTASTDRSQHVLAGDILSPGSTADLTDMITAFVARPAADAVN